MYLDGVEVPLHDDRVSQHLHDDAHLEPRGLGTCRQVIGRPRPLAPPAGDDEHLGRPQAARAPDAAHNGHLEKRRRVQISDGQELG
jgi:hypothetical protein